MFVSLIVFVLNSILCSILFGKNKLLNIWFKSSEKFERLNNEYYIYYQLSAETIIITISNIYKILRTCFNYYLFYIVFI